MADNAAIWRTCLHEAAHAVAGRRLLKRTTRALVFANASGVADLGGESGEPTSFKKALVTAAGQAAEVLADLYPVPQVPLPVPLEEAYPETAGRMMQRVSSFTTDDVCIARWCIEGREYEPDSWAERHDWVRGSAEEFIEEHQQEIVEAATGLFARGVITLGCQQEVSTEGDW